MGLWKRFKRAVTRFFSGGGGGGGGRSTPSRRVYNNRDSRRVTSSNTSARRAYINAYKGERDDLNREGSISDAWEKTRKAFKASSSSRTPEPIAQKKQQDILRERRKKETKDWYKATNHRYDVSGAKDDTEKLKRRQAVKSRAYDSSTAVKEEKHELKYHPYAYSAARRGARGLSLTGELLEKKGTKGEAKKAQQYFEKNQNKVAGGIGEAAGTMAAFALTANPSKAVVKKALPKAVRVSAEKGGEKLAARLAEKKLIRKAAEKEVKNAVGKGITKKVTKSAVENATKQKAKEIVSNLGEDFAQNITTGAINDISRASANHKVGSKGWWKEVGTSGVLNFGLGGASTVGLPALGKGVKRALGGVSEGVENVVKKDNAAYEALARKAGLSTLELPRVSAKKQPPKVKVDLGRKKTTDLKLNSIGHAGGVGSRKFVIEAGSPSNGKTKRFTINANKASEAAEDASLMMAGSDTPFVRVVGEVGGKRSKNVTKAVEPPKAKAKEPIDVDAELDRMIQEASTVEDYMNLGLSRPEAEILAQSKAKVRGAEEVPKVGKEEAKGGVKRGNIKPLAETLRGNEFIPRSRNAEWRTPPRSVERVDTSIEGLARQLDELKGRASQASGRDTALETKINDVTDRLERAKWRKEGGADMEAMQKAYRGEYDGFDMSKSTNGYQNNVLEGKEDGKVATIVEMSPDEYMERAYRQIFKKPSEKGKVFADIPEHSEDIAKYAEAMQNGEKFPLPYLDYAKGGQEGRHRALAAKAAGIDRIPVVIIDDATKPKAIIDEVAEATAKSAEAVNPQSDFERLGNNFEKAHRGRTEELKKSHPDVRIKRIFAEDKRKKILFGENELGELFVGNPWSGFGTISARGNGFEGGFYKAKDFERASKDYTEVLGGKGLPKNTPKPKAIIDEVAEATAKAETTDWRESLVDANSVDEFIEANLNNKGFAEYGRSKDTSINDIRNLWYETRMKQNPMEAHEIGIEEANDIIRKELPENVRSGWFRNADSEYKPHAMYYLSGNGEARNAGLNIGYWNYKNASPNNTLSFDEWLVTPQKMYRGSRGQKTIDDDIFSAFTPDRSVAEKFATGKNASIDEITVRPIDTLGSYQTTSEQEFLVPQDVINAAKQGADEVAEATAKADSVLGKGNSLPSRADITSGKATYGGITLKYKPDMDAEARNYTTEIHISDKFFEQPEDIQQHILNHEVAHNWADELMGEHTGDWNDFVSKFITEKPVPKSSDAYKNGQRTYWEGLYGDIGANSASETITRATTEYLDDPDALMKRSPEAYETIREFVERKNAPTGASIDVPDEKAYNEMRRLGNEAEVGDIRTAQAGGETVPSVDGEISTRGGADNGGVERIADASSDEGRRSGVGVLRVSPSNRAKLTESGVTDTRLSDVSDDYATFSNALEAAKEANGHGGWVDSQTVEDLTKGKAKAYLSDDGYAGVAVKEDGDICGVFKHPDSKHRGAAYDLVFTARANGGTKMDCFGKGLVNRYESVGYVPVARLDFNPEYVDDPRLIKEAPDVYVLMKNTDDLDTVASKIKKPESEGGYHRSTQEELDNLPSFGDDYDAALAYRDKMLAEQTAAESPFPYEGTPEAEALVRGQRSAPLSVDEMAGVDEAMPSTNPRQTEANETIDALERRVAQIAEEPPKEADDSLKINAGEEATVGGRPSGVRQVRSAYEYANGEPIEDGILTSWNEAWQASKEYSASHARGNKSRMSKVAVSELNAMDSDAERELRQRLADSGELNYDAISTPELYDKIAKQMRDDPDRWVKDMIDINQGGALDFRSTPEWQARVQYIMGTVDPSADEASEIAYTEAFKLAQNISSKGGQTLNLRRNFVHLTPMGKRDAILDDFVNILSKSKGFQKNHPQMRTLGHFDRRNYIRNVLMEDDAIRDGVEKLVNADDPNAVGDAFTELMYNVNKKNPKSGFDVLQELRYLNMLGNIKTHGRNVFGSAFFIPIREASNSIRSLIEKPIEKWASQYGKFDVAKHGAVWQRSTPEAKNAANEAFEALKNDVLGSAKYETVSYKGRGKTAVGKAVDALSDFNSTLLTKEDDAFRTRAFKNSYAKSYSRYQRDGKPITDKIKRKIEQEAIRESQVATFNEYNSFASFLNNITRKATDAEASTGARWGGRALNAVMPFTKVPANLMNQSLNYSPLGLARGMANIKTAAKTGDSAALNTAIDQLASGMTGSAVFGLGMLLGKTTDMFTTNAGKNDPAAKFKKDRGMQNYSVTFKDPETGQGYSFTLDWLVPTSATFFSGVEMANQLKKGDFNVLDIGGDWSSVVSRLAEPVMETSMLSGLHGMLETMRGGSNADDDKGAISILLRETVQSYMNSLVPTLAGQISRTAYKSDMQIVGDTDWEYWRNQMKSKAGLANTNILGEALGADTDAYGNVKGEKKNGADYAKSALKNFLSPANIQKVDFSKVDDEKLRVYEEAVKNGADPEEMAYLFPKKQYKKQFKVAGEEIKMSNKDVSTYNQAKTTGGEEGMRYILENIMFNRQTLNENGDKVPADSAYTKEQKQALMNEFKGKSMREVEEWLYSQPEFKTATDAEKKKAINGLWTLDSMFDSKANASRRVGEQAVYKAQGKDVNEYNFKNEVSEKKRKALEPLVAAGVVSYEEAVDFARNAGKTYYYENEDGGQSATYYNKKEMIQYLIDKGYSYEKAEALFNAFKAPKAKPYSGNNLSSGKGRRRRKGYRRRGGGGSSKTVKTSVPIKASDYKASKGTYKDMASALQVRSTSKRKTSTKSTAVPKITPPKVKFKKYEV